MSKIVEFKFKRAEFMIWVCTLRVRHDDNSITDYKVTGHRRKVRRLVRTLCAGMNVASPV